LASLANRQSAQAVHTVSPLRPEERQVSVETQPSPFFFFSSRIPPSYRPIPTLTLLLLIQSTTIIRFPASISGQSICPSLTAHSTSPVPLELVHAKIIHPHRLPRLTGSKNSPSANHYPPWAVPPPNNESQLLGPGRGTNPHSLVRPHLLPPPFLSSGGSRRRSVVLLSYLTILQSRRLPDAVLIHFERHSDVAS
jgi:hypothetical protein